MFLYQYLLHLHNLTSVVDSRAHIHTHTHTYTRRDCSLAYTHRYTYTTGHTHTHARTHTHIHTQGLLTNLHTQIHLHNRTHTHTHTHAHTHTHTGGFQLLLAWDKGVYFMSRRCLNLSTFYSWFARNSQRFKWQRVWRPWRLPVLHNMQIKNTSGDIRFNTHKKTLAHTDTSHTHKHTYTHTYVYTYTAVNVHSLTSSIVSSLLTISEKRSQIVAENLAKTKLS